MKTLVFLLVLANLFLFAFGEGYLGKGTNPDAGRLQQQVSPERIRIMARGEPPAAPGAGKEEDPAAAGRQVVAGSFAIPGEAAAPTQPAAPVQPAASVPEAPPACLAWSDLPGAAADRLAALLGDKFPDFRLERRPAAGDGGGWWVYIPPHASKTEADRKVAELRRLGVSDYFVIQEAGPNRFAISLGVFSSEAGADEHLASLKAKGVKSARAGLRAGKQARQTIEARGPAARQPALQEAVAALLPESTARPCPDRR